MSFADWVVIAVLALIVVAWDLRSMSRKFSGRPDFPPDDRKS